jgi:hypothetical protein
MLLYTHSSSKKEGGREEENIKAKLRSENVAER